MFKTIISNSIRLTTVKKKVNCTANLTTDKLQSIGGVVVTVPQRSHHIISSAAVGITCHTTAHKATPPHQLKFASSNSTAANHNNNTHSNSIDKSRRAKRTMSMSSGDSIATDQSVVDAKPKPKHTNRLAQSKSPYLLQHAHNPVDWYPWGDEAIERAKRENKVIFLSVGYSTCHWCHVMERESFEDEAVAAIMNEHFINIKVDREERPDIDRIYMQFVLLLNGSGGWPMSVWLTPNLTPITAGTYFPPQNRYGMPSFTTVLKTIAEKWTNERDQLTATGQEVINVIQSTLTEKSSDTILPPGSADAKLQEALRIFTQRYDTVYGGFGSNPKFPEVSRLNFLFHAYIVIKDSDILDMVMQTLHHIGKGGIHDHVFGGFARYSVDRAWHVPHFEKMLYDQGQLMSAYGNGFKLARDNAFLRYADGIFRYIMKDLRHPSGGFFSGEDADSYAKEGDKEKVEGAFYAWSFDEIKEAVLANASLYKDADPDLAFEIYAHHYDIRPAGNVEPSSDPHGHLTGKNILIVRGSEEQTCAKFNVSEEKLLHVLQTTNEVLHKERNKRPRPHLDTKIICAWNGLVLSGLAKLANCGCPKREEYVQAARELVDFIKEHLYDAEKKVLIRSCYGLGPNSDILELNSEPIYGFLDDYAFLIKGLLDYYKATLEPDALLWAKELQDIQDSLFWDENNGAYFYSQANSANVIVRLKEDHDGAEPSGNSVAARNLILLSHYFDDESYRERANGVLQFFADTSPFGYTLPAMLSALLLYENGLDLVAVVGPANSDTSRFVEICRRYFIPGMIIFRVDPNDSDPAHNERIQKKFKMVNGKPTVYICHDKACRMPVTDAETLEHNLQDNFYGNRF